MDLSQTFAVADERYIWGIDLDERQAILCRERVAGAVWSRTVSVRAVAQLLETDAAGARAHFAALGHREAQEPWHRWERPIQWARRKGQRKLAINLISHDNGVGLTQDQRLLRALLEREGHEVHYCEWRNMSSAADINIYLELFETKHLQTARSHIGIFNLEWYDKYAVGHLRSMTQCWAKSMEAARIYDQVGGVRGIYTGFLSRDMRRRVPQRERTCLHVRGKASQKATDVVLEAWRRHGDYLPRLIVTAAEEFDGWRNTHEDVEVRFGFMKENELATLMSRCWFHVCPSEAEGWGHYIAEGLSSEAVVTTVDASPMNEHVQPAWGVLLPGKPVAQGLVTRHRADPDDLANAILKLEELDDAELGAMGARARDHWEARQASFTERALALLSQV